MKLLKAFPVMKQLRTHLDEETYLDLVLDAKENIDIKCSLYLMEKKSLQ